MNCPFALDDGAYVLGALAPAERALFERHLPSCQRCREAVAALAVLPGLLGRLDPPTAVAISPAEAQLAPRTLLPRTLAAVALRLRRERRRRRWIVVATVAAALCFAAVVGVAGQVADGPRQPALAAMHQVRPEIPVSGEVGLVPVGASTRVEMTCRYDSGYEEQWAVHLVVYPRWDGTPEQISSWTAGSGQDITIQAMTHFATGEIGRIELHRGDHTPVLTWSPP